MVIPDHAAGLLQQLEEAGYSAWAVGGCVRDSLLGNTPHDYDLCTSASPQQMQALFSHRRLVLAGEKHGTVGVVTDGGVVEITTYRTEGDYTDRRHPGWVRFVSTVEEDLARRDFTVNAMAYSPLRGLADPFGGQRDLENRVLRAVGDPWQRFREDALRILRGVRFSLRYRLTPEKRTLQAMEELAPLLHQLARERVFDELCKLIPLATTQDLLLYQPVLEQVLPLEDYVAAATAAGALPADNTLRWAALLCFSQAAPQEVLTTLRSPGEFKKAVCLLTDNARQPLLPRDLPEFLLDFPRQQLPQLLLLRRALGQNTGPLQQALEDIPSVTLQTLAVTGKDLVALGIPPGKELGQALRQLLLQVLRRQVLNRREDLLQVLKQ
jgi:tRNA nucleotidyltransferase (CCA-adding enzyme)